MTSPPKKRGLCRAALQTLRLHVAYIASAFLAKAFEGPFWFWNQKRGQLLDQIDNQGRE